MTKSETHSLTTLLFYFHGAQILTNMLSFSSMCWANWYSPAVCCFHYCSWHCWRIWPGLAHIVAVCCSNRIMTLWSNTIPDLTSFYQICRVLWAHYSFLQRRRNLEYLYLHCVWPKLCTSFLFRATMATAPYNYSYIFKYIIIGKWAALDSCLPAGRWQGSELSSSLFFLFLCLRRRHGGRKVMFASPVHRKEM